MPPPRASEDLQAQKGQSSLECNTLDRNSCKKIEAGPPIIIYITLLLQEPAKIHCLYSAQAPLTPQTLAF